MVTADVRVERIVEPRERILAKNGVDMNLADLERIPRARDIDAEQFFHRAGGARGPYDVARGRRVKVPQPWDAAGDAWVSKERL